MSFEQLLSKITTPAAQDVARHWNEVRGKRLMPAWEDINPAAIARHLPFVWSWKYDAATDEMIGRLAGDRIVDALRGNLRGQTAREFFKDRGGNEMVERARRVMTEPCFFYGRGAVFSHTKRVVDGERVILPLSTDGKTADGIFGITVFDTPSATSEIGDYPHSETGEFIPL